jgi:hypothetical protein
LGGILFEQDQHEALIRKLSHIHQITSVTAYVDQFFALVDQVTAYEYEANLLYYSTHFVDGLREDIKAMVMIQRPSTFDAACALALVQEEVVDSN